MDRAARCAGRTRIPGESHRVSRRDGGPRPARQALPGLRCPSAANRLCGERDQLLRALPDRRQDPRRPCAVAPAEEDVSALDRRAGIVYGTSIATIVAL